MVYILLARGFEEAEALVPADLLRRAGAEVALTSLDGQTVTGGHAIAVKADLTLDQVDLDRAEMVVLPGGGVGVKNLGAEPRVEALVRQAVDREIWVAAICAAPTLLGRWGLLRGKKAICYPGMEDQLAGAQVQPAPGVVTDGRIITSRAAGSAFDFGVALIEVLAGSKAAGQVVESIAY